MKTSKSSRFLLTAVIFFTVIDGYSQVLLSELSSAEKKLYFEHVFLGQPDEGGVLVRQGYVARYSQKFRIPMWVSYHLNIDYLNTPKRKKKYKYFRTDKTIDNPVVNSDYTGSGYARGHYAPYFVMGGDRDKNGKRSDLFDDSKDPYDDLTVFQANYMSNIAPQDQSALNGPGGPWYALETKIRTKIVPKLKDLTVIVGGIISDSINYKTLKNKYVVTDIAIPDKFYQVIIYQEPVTKKYEVLAFLFPHLRERANLPYSELIQYVVPIDSVEKLADLDFFPDMDDAQEDTAESNIALEFWRTFFE